MYANVPLNRPYCADSTKRALGKKKKCKRSGAVQAAPLQFLTGCAHGCKINEIVNEMVSLLESLDFFAVDTFYFEDREEILGHGVIIAISSS